MHPEKRYPRTGDRETVYLKQVITNPNIRVGDFTMYHDFIHDPRQFEQNAVRYHYPLNHDKLIIGKFCSIACGVQFLFNSANHTKKSLSTYPFPLFFEEWGLDIRDVASAWDNKGDIVIGNDVWIGYEAILLAGVTIGDGAVIGTRALVTKDVPPYTIVGGTPARVLRKRFSEDTISALLRLKWWDWPIEHIQRYIPEIQSGQVHPLHIPNKNVPQDQMSCGTSAFLLVGTYSCAAPSAAASGRSQLVIIPPSSSKVAVFTIWDLPTRISWVPSSLDRLSFTVPSMVKTRL